MEHWYIPMTLIPGLSLLILSTSNLMITLSNELDTLIENHSREHSIILRKMEQLKALNLAMVYFYVAVACLAIAGVIGGLQILAVKNSGKYVSVLGIIIMLLGLVTLIRYSYKAVSIRQDQLNLKIDPSPVRPSDR